MESVGGYAYFVSEGTLSADPKFLFFFFLKTFFIRFSSSKTYTVNEFNYFLSDFCPTVLKVKRIKDCDSIIYPLFSCGGLTLFVFL